MSSSRQRAIEVADERWGRSDAARTGQDTGESQDKIDRLVATYATIGRQKKREHRRRRVKRASLGLALIPVVALVVVALGEQAGWPFGEDSSARLSLREQLRDTRDLQMALVTEMAAIEQHRRAVAQQREALALDLAAIIDQRTELASRQAAVETQREALTAELEAVDAERERLLAERSAVAEERPQLEQAIADIETQRRELERQQASFRSQRERLAGEIDDLRSQRVALEQQRRELENQWSELQGLMESIEDGGDAGSQPRPALEEPADAGASTEPDIQANAAEPFVGRFAAVADAQLGEMRGGISFGDDLSIAIGLTRTASINGVDHYSSSLHIDDLNAVSLADLAAANTTLLIQNGSGNSVSPAALEALSNGMATIIQNTLDDQNIATRNVFDITIDNASSAINDITAINAIRDSVSMQP